MGNKKSLKKSLIKSTVIPIFIVGMLIILGSAQAVSVVFSGLEPSYTQGKPVRGQQNSAEHLSLTEQRYQKTPSSP